jgi:hypothetical protein
MNRVDAFSELLDDDSEIFRRYVRRRKNWKNAPVFVFEGDDEKYYSSAITVVISGEWHTFIPGRKSDVIQLRNDIRGNKQMKDDCCFFFVDRDYIDETKAATDLYVTPTHSIENLYCSTTAVRALIRGECGLARGDKEENQTEEILIFLVNLYEYTRSQYLSAGDVRKFNLMFSVYSGSGMTDKLNVNDNLKMNISFIEIAGGQISVETSYSCAKELSLALDKYVRKQNSFLFSKRPEVRGYFNPLICRGKQEIYFLYKYIESLKNGVIGGLVRARFGKKLKIGFNGGADDLLSFAAQYADKPACLFNFLSRVPSCRFSNAA